MTILKIQALLSVFLFSMFINCATAEPTMEIVPGQSVGKVKLGMSRDDVRSTLGDPKREFPSWDGISVFVYESASTGNTLNAFFKDEKLCGVEFTSPDFRTADGTSTENVKNEGLINSYLHLKSTDGNEEGWRHPNGGLIFTFHTDGKATGLVYGPQIEQILNKTYVTEPTTQIVAEVPKENLDESTSTTASSHWIGRYRFIEEWPGDPPSIYTLQVSCIEGDSCATLSAHGRQTEFDVICGVRKDGESLVIVFAHDAPGTEFDSKFTKGDVLFSLDHREDGETITRWNKLESVYLQNREAGNYFKKMLPGYIERELPADLESDSDATQEDLAVFAKPGVDLKDLHGRQPTDDMLVFKGLYIGMDIGQAALKLDEAVDFRYEILETQKSTFKKAGLGFKIFAVLEKKSIEITEAGVELPQNKFYRYDIPSPDEQLLNRIEFHFNRLHNLEQTLELIVGELNAGLANWVQISEDGLLVSKRQNLFELVANSNQEIIRIVIEPALTNSWFNVEDMSAGNFTQKFITSYNIPMLEIEIEDYNTGLIRSPAGYKLTITDSKKIIVEVAERFSETRRKFD